MQAFYSMFSFDSSLSQSRSCLLYTSRPRFGVMRSREFLMKDAYSFHTSQESLQETYDAMYAASVSYTHLDVYKRQAFTPPTS